MAINLLNKSSLFSYLPIHKKRYKKKVKHSVQIQNNVRCIDSNSFPNSKGITTHEQNVKIKY